MRDKIPGRENIKELRGQGIEKIINIDIGISIVTFSGSESKLK